MRTVLDSNQISFGSKCSKGKGKGKVDLYSAYRETSKALTTG